MVRPATAVSIRIRARALLAIPVQRARLRSTTVPRPLACTAVHAKTVLAPTLVRARTASVVRIVLVSLTSVRRNLARTAARVSTRLEHMRAFALRVTTDRRAIRSAHNNSEFNPNAE